MHCMGRYLRVCINKTHRHCVSLFTISHFASWSPILEYISVTMVTWYLTYHTAQLLWLHDTLLLTNIHLSYYGLMIPCYHTAQFLWLHDTLLSYDPISMVTWYLTIIQPHFESFEVIVILVFVVQNKFGISIFCLVTKGNQLFCLIQ